MAVKFQRSKIANHLVQRVQVLHRISAMTEFVTKMAVTSTLGAWATGVSLDVAAASQWTAGVLSVAWFVCVLVPLMSWNVLTTGTSVCRTSYCPAVRKKVTVVTQFITEGNTDDGDLIDIRRFYVQDGKVIPNSNISIAGVTGDSITDKTCADMKAWFQMIVGFQPKI